MAIATLGVVVKDGATGRALPGATVCLLRGPCPVSRCATDKDGIVRFPSACAGYHQVIVTRPMYRRSVLQVLLNANQSQMVSVAIHLLRRVYFAAYYFSTDNAFKRAADTWAASLGGRGQLDVVIVKEVKTEDDFRRVWLDIERESSLPGRGVMEGHLFTHASKGDQDDGLEFSQQGADGTLNRGELSSLRKLNWELDGRLVLHGCNTGLKGTRGWTPAEELAKTQGVKTSGQSGYAYYSVDSATYREIDSRSSTVYLWAYRRKRNGIAGDGTRMPPVEY